MRFWTRDLNGEEWGVQFSNLSLCCSQLSLQTFTLRRNQLSSPPWSSLALLFLSRKTV
jgi:hypothetical protein